MGLGILGVSSILHMITAYDESLTLDNLVRPVRKITGVTQSHDPALPQRPHIAPSRL